MQRCIELIASKYSFPDYCIVQFAKSPASTQVKTRLAPQLPADQRLRLHQAMTRHISETVAAAELCPLHLWITGEMEHPFLANLSRALQLPCFQQEGGDLGARMQHAAEQTLANFGAVIFIGSDCPFIDTAYLRQAMRELADNDAVLGPATDGGYVLLGLRSSSPALFQDIPWGGHEVLRTTQARLDELGWDCALLPPLADIDRPEDLRLLAGPGLPEHLRQFSDPGLPGK